MDSFFLVFRSARLRLFVSEISSTGSVVAASFVVTLTMCVTVKANALKEENVQGRDVRADQLCYVVSHW